MKKHFRPVNLHRQFGLGDGRGGGSYSEKDDVSDKVSDALDHVIKRFMAVCEQFMEAVERGRSEEVLRMINQEGVPVDYQDPVTGKSALHVAATSCARPVVLALINTGKCNYLLRDKKGRLASEMAFVYGDDPALARLLRIKEVKQAESEGIKLTRRPRPEA